MDGRKGFRIGSRKTKATNDRILWRAMITNVLKRHGTYKKHKEKYNVYLISFYICIY